MLYFLFFPAEKAHDRQNLKEPVQNFGHYYLLSLPLDRRKTKLLMTNH